MQNKGILAILATLLVFLGGCATKNQRSVQTPIRPLSQEEAVARREQKALKYVGFQEKWKESLGLDCPSGGRENVIISDELGREAFRVGGNRVAKFLLARYTGLVEVSNPYDETVTISEGGRLMVSNMCPHGTITLAASLGFLAGTVSGSSGYYSQDFVWTARRVVGGRFYYGVSQRMSLYIYQWEKEKKAQWVMEVDRVDSRLP